jgi:sugar porter (SP) family MFS transporter
MFSSQTIPSVLFFLGLLIVSESPRWLIWKNRDAEAIKVLEKIGGKEYAEKEDNSIRESFINKSKENIRSLFKKDVSHIVIIGIVIAIFSQAGGQNSILSYAPEIFKQAGLAEDSAFLQSVLLGLILSLFTFIAITTIDKTGRKNLLMYGALLLAIDAISLAIAFHFNAGSLVILILVLTFIAIYSATLGPVTWVVLSEIFPNRIRGNAMSLATLSLWVSNFFTVSLFPVMKSQFGIGITFGFHGLVCLIYFVFVHFRIPETKGKSLEEIEGILIRKK